MDTFFFAVGWTNQRPIRPDEWTSFVTVQADTLAEASQLAAQLVGVRAEMVTSTELLMVEV